MSFEVFVSCYRNKQAEFYDRQIAEEIFNRDALESSVPLDFVRYADGIAEIYGAEGDRIDGLMISRFSRTALARLFELASVTGSLIFWPSTDTHMAATSTATLSHLPDEIIELGETIAIVRSVEELIAVAEFVFI